MDYAGPFGIFSFGRRTIRDWSASHPRSPPFQVVRPCQPERWDVVLILFSHYHSAMHPPPFRTDHRLSDWPACRLELNCCRGQTIVPLRLLATQYGDPTFAVVTGILWERARLRPDIPETVYPQCPERSDELPMNQAVIPRR